MGYFTELAANYGVEDLELLFSTDTNKNGGDSSDSTTDQMEMVSPNMSTLDPQPIAKEKTEETVSVNEAPMLAVLPDSPINAETLIMSADAKGSEAPVAEIANNAPATETPEPVDDTTVEETVKADPTDDGDAKKADSAPKTLEERKKEHEELEAARKAEWDAKQKKRKEEEERKWQAVLAIGVDEIGSASAAHVSAGTEKLTRRNMKICVSEHIQAKCASDLDFARKVMHPRKNMINCFRYINKKALDFIKQEMEDNDEKAANDGFGGDVPDDLCYEWAEDYFLDMDAEVDKCGDEEFVPKQFYGGTATTKKKPAKKKAKKESKPVNKEVDKMESAQLSLLDVS